MEEVECIYPTIAQWSKRSYRTMRGCDYSAKLKGKTRHSRQDGDDRHISRIDSQNGDDAHEVPHHTVDALAFLFAHKESDICLPQLCKGRKSQSSEIDGIYAHETSRKRHEKRSEIFRVEIVEQKGEESNGRMQ